jgi:hypothetical protein
MHCVAILVNIEIAKQHYRSRRVFLQIIIIALLHLLLPLNFPPAETGWGNTLAGLANAGSLALLLGSRLHVQHAAFNRMFDAPYDDSPSPPPASSFSMSVSSAPAEGSSSIAFDYEKYGRGGCFAAFADSLRASASTVIPASTSKAASSIKSPSSSSSSSSSHQSHVYQQHSVVVSRMCGTDPSFVTTGGCAFKT